MQGRLKRPEYLALAVVTLLILNVLIYQAAFTPRLLTVAVLDIGQGDAVLIEGPTGITMLVDGGPDRGVLRELGAVLRVGERTLDAVVATHPDKDHIGGLPDVFANYEVNYFLESGVENDTNPTKALAEASAAESGMTRVLARRGMILALGGGAYAEILYPDRDVSKVETNDGSIVMRVVYGSTSFILTGDLPSDIEGWLVRLDGARLDSDILKVGHHGSKYSTSDKWLAAVSPASVAVSVGERNSYGHPTPEVLTRVANAGAAIYRTDRDGRLVFATNGVQVTKR